MLLIDNRTGSKDMLAPLERQGIACDLARLEYGDFAFVGRGIADESITVGIELKRVHGSDSSRSDLLTSLRSGRLAGHQLGGIQAYDRAWLITEGLWRGNDEGVLEVWERGKWAPIRNGRSQLMMKDVEAQLFSLTIRGGMSYWHCPTSRDTLRFIVGLYRWWTDKSLDEHRSHQAIYVPPPDRALFVEPSSLVMMMYAGIKGLGYDKALAIEAHFGADDGAFERVFAASLKELRAVPGIGTTLAERIYTVLHSAASLSSSRVHKVKESK